MRRNVIDDVPAEVARFLDGRRVLIVGGDCRPEQLRRLRAAFPATEFSWRPTRQSNASLEAFEQQIAQCDFSVVIIIYGLARTAHTKGARRLCSMLHKPLLWCRRPTVAAVVRALTDSRVAA